MKKTSTLVLYCSTDGHTKSIVETIHDKLSSTSKHCMLLADLDQGSVNLADYDVIVLGASVRYGKHRKRVSQFMVENQTLLASKLFVFFSVNLTARKPEKATPETSNYTKKLYQQTGIRPDLDAVFAGKLNYPAYRFFDKWIIRFIMYLTGGPTDLSTVKDFTDWQQVDCLAKQINDKLSNNAALSDE